ncbi:MAG TPA: ADYC domain-containing protein [Archangium sp.]|uniref:ADYC domain-containing protein n=1 Tax=Archangium sp. TaxID=1872627 RepID=UPI002E307CC5|nr:ADYC domain-containing protein [Archangium sp.]HEX5748800.1 ADYC domain-containing protein [Archangium sp.]
MKHSLLLFACLLFAAPGLAEARGRIKPCQGQGPRRTVWPQGTLLWGTERQVVSKEMSSVLASVDLGRVRLGSTAVKGLRIEEGHLAARSLGPKGLVGAVFQGTASDGQPVEVALCGAEPSPTDPSMVWYRIELWNARSASWENPCVATGRESKPRALAVRGVWDETGARHEVPGKFTFACEHGAIAKCIGWGYKPWATKDGHALEDLHQACTRMARADYCGNGSSHTRQDNPIDMYDALRVSTRTTEATRGWEPRRASFEAAWTPEGAWCLARTRDGQAAEAVLAQCPDRFEAEAQDLGEGDRCTVRRKGGRAGPVLLRNQSYGKASPAP